MLASVERALDAWTTILDVGALTAQAQSVVTYRSLGMTGNWSLEQDENQRMVSEKQSAFMEANIAATRAILSGKKPDQVTRAFISPLSETVESNVTRLQQRGPAGMAALFNKSVI